MHRYPKILAEAPLGRHFCQIHDDAATLTKAVSAYASIGLVSGNAVVVAAEPSRVVALKASLHAAGLRVDECVRTGQLTLLDVDALLAKIMDGDMPDPAAFRRVIGGVLREISANGYRHTRVYGELVNVLWRIGNPVAAIALEEYWNELAFEHRFALFCGYEIDGLDDKGYDSPLGEIARCHSDMLETEHDERLQDALDRASAEILGLPISSALCYFGQDQHEAEHRLPAGRRTMLWLRRNMPGAVGKVVARARVHYGHR
ncbi:MAG: MEDS domain-containing protein [Gammaproteobacteria bacterium]